MNWIDPPGGKPWALFGLCGASALLNVVLLASVFTGDDATTPPSEPCIAEAQSAAASNVPSVEMNPAAMGTHSPKGATVTVGSAVVPTVVANNASTTAATAVPAGMHRVWGTLTHSLVRTFQNEAGEHADVLNAVYSRLFFWDLDLRRDLQKGDEVEVAYSWDGKLAHIDVARYHSLKLGEVLTAYKFTATGDRFSSYWTLEGKEVSRRLKNSPLKEYQQVTALIKDRPSHKGMDFKTPVGTEIVSPKSATVVRTNWNMKFNGNSIELRYADGALARFLHLSDTGVRAGQTVSAGQRIGATGNTGRSTAPHLHYEIEKAGRVIDPVDYHGTTRRTLPAVDTSRFEQLKTELNRLLQRPS